MAKPNLRSLNKMNFTKVIPTRNQIISEAPATVLPSLSSYKANEIAAALHPSCQYLKVAKVIDEVTDVKSFILVPDVESGTQSLDISAQGSI